MTTNGRVDPNTLLNGSGYMELIRQDIPARRTFRIQFRRRQTGPGGLDVDGHLGQSFNGLRIGLEAHDFGQG